MEQCLEFFITFVKTNIKLGLYNYHMPTFFMAPMLILVIYLDIKEIYFVLLAVKCKPLAINMQNLWCIYLGQPKIQSTCSTCNFFKEKRHEFHSLQGLLLLKQLTQIKGQLISKGLFAIINSSKKRTKQFDLTTMIPQVDLFLLIF